MSKLIKFEAYGEEYNAQLFIDSYDNGNTSVQLYEATTGEPLCSLSVNTGDVLPAGHFYLKNWSENELVTQHENVRAVLRVCEQHAPYFSGYVVARCHTLAK